MSAATLEDFRELSFAYITPLELLYPMFAYCDLGLVAVYDAINGIYNLIFQQPWQLIINLVRWLGSIMFAFMSFTDCLWLLDGKCAGQKHGTLVYYLFYFRDIYDAANLPTYDAAL